MTTVLISGASIAGPALAHWLRVRGMTPTVVERAGAVRSGGYPIDVRGVAIEVADRMGVLPQLRAAHVATSALHVVDAAGRRRVSIAPGAVSGGAEAHDVELPRGELTSILYELTRNDVEYVFGDTMTALHEHDGGVDVEFANGPSRTFDLVVGTDGVHSTTRRLVFGPAADYQHHLGYHFAAFTVPNHLGLDHEAVLHNVPGKIVAINAVRTSPEVTALFAMASPELAFDDRDLDQQRQLIEEAFTGVGWETPRLLKAMWEAPDFYFDSVGQVLMPGWTRGRVALLGDAAFAPSFLSGQGTSLALVGAYVLAGELAAAGGDPAVGLPAYEERLRPFVGRNQALVAEGAGTLIPATRGKIWLRNQMFRLAPLLGRLSRGTTPIERAANSFTLPAY
ncbi:FAD-dependent monooxygenase [Pseudonocardia sp. TRM90224]|uniref:FAD-dependent monooxygenase n=1 Tax=Pseudonocardia sp. TRM90224 TaxID=2812678 RepID=UPI001E5B59B8|nr:FAD-dependent monooxygenase [Pseudonocardia sp. TRM90224]